MVYPGSLIHTLVSSTNKDLSFPRRSLQIVHEFKLCVLCGSQSRYKMYAPTPEYLLEGEKYSLKIIVYKLKRCLMDIFTQ